MISEIKMMNNRITSILETYFQTDIDRVWKAVTTPEIIEKWLARTDLELKPDGIIRLYFENTDSIVNGIIMSVCWPSFFQFTWKTPNGDELITWYLEQTEKGTRFTHKHTFNAGGVHIIQMCAGWHSHFELLENVLAGEECSWNLERWNALYHAYQEAIGEDYLMKTREILPIS